MTDFAPYMRWAKQHPPARYDLSGSNLVSCTLDDLPGAADALTLNGLNPDGYPPLVDAIAQRYGVPRDRIATAQGAGGANFLALAALVQRGDEVLVERPAYDPLLGALRLLGAHVGRFERTHDEGWRLDPERIAAALSARTRLIVLTNPHNPGGVLDSTSTLAEIASVAERVGAHVLVDEVYLDLAVAPGTARPAASLSDVLISTSSLTKSHGLNGLRAGWIIASPDIAERIRRVRDVMDGISPIITDRLAALAFRHIDRLEARARAIVEPNRRLLIDFIAGTPRLDCVLPAATVAFPRLRGVEDAGPFVETLRRNFETQLAPGSFFEAPAHFRIALAGEGSVLEAGLTRVAAALAEFGGA